MTNKSVVKKTEQFVSTSDLREGTFTNSVGEVFKIHGLPPFLLPTLSEDIKKPSKPTYTVTTASGDVETHEHDAQSLVTEEDKLAWEKYVEETKAADQILSDRMLNCILLEAVELPDTYDSKRFSTRLRLMRMEIPEDTEELELMFKKTRVIRSVEDAEALITLALRLTGVDQEVVEMTKRSFQDSMESQARPDDGSTPS